MKSENEKIRERIKRDEDIQTWAENNTGYAALIELISIPYSVIVWAHITFVTYGWFILSVFPGAPVFSFTQTIGFVLFKSVVLHTSGTLKYRREIRRPQFAVQVDELVLPWVALFGLWLLKLMLL